MTGPGKMDRLTHQRLALLLTCKGGFVLPIHGKYAAKVPRKRREACAKTQWARYHAPQKTLDNGTTVVPHCAHAAI